MPLMHNVNAHKEHLVSSRVLLEVFLGDAEAFGWVFYLMRLQDVHSLRCANGTDVSYLFEGDVSTGLGTQASCGLEPEDDRV